MQIRNLCLPVIILSVAGLVACGDAVVNDTDTSVGGADTVEPVDVLAPLDVLPPWDVLTGDNFGQDLPDFQDVFDDVAADSGISDTGPEDNGPDVQQTGLYITRPDLSSCDPGVLTDFQKQLVLDRVNYIRDLHDLEPVYYNDEGDTVTAECSLTCLANESLSHEPPEDWACWSQEAYDGCSQSNIFIQWGVAPTSYPSPDIVDGFMTDEGVETLGHRRWLIDPWLAYISFGRVDNYADKMSTAAIKVFNDDLADISSSEITMVAYPYGDGYPASLYNDNVMMSFSVVDNVSNKWANGDEQINFSSASITITDRQDNPVNVRDVQYDNKGFGIPNNLRGVAMECGVEKP